MPPKLKNRIINAKKKKNQYVLDSKSSSLAKPVGYKARVRKSDKLNIVSYKSKYFKKHRIVRRAFVNSNDGLGGRNVHCVRIKVQTKKYAAYKYISIIAASNVGTSEHSEDRTSGLISYLKEKHKYVKCEVVSDRTERERCARCRKKHPPEIEYHAGFEYPRAGDYDANKDKAKMAQYDRQANNKEMAKQLIEMQLDNSDDESDNDSDDDELIVDGDTIPDSTKTYLSAKLPNANITFLYDE
jgi:hypothetical protein